MIIFTRPTQKNSEAVKSATGLTGDFNVIRASLNESVDPEFHIPSYHPEEICTAIDIAAVSDVAVVVPNSSEVLTLFSLLRRLRKKPLTILAHNEDGVQEIMKLEVE